MSSITLAEKLKAGVADKPALLRIQETSRVRIALDAFERNAGAYERAVDALDEIAARYDAVAAEVRSGRLDALAAFSTAVTQQLSLEHKRWLEGTAQAEAVFRQLDQQLDRLAA